MATDYPPELAYRDEQTALAIERACVQLRRALKEMPNDRRSLFTGEDAKQVNACLLNLQVQSADALCALGKEIPKF